MIAKWPVSLLNFTTLEYIVLSFCVCFFFRWLFLKLLTKWVFYQKGSDAKRKLLLNKCVSTACCLFIGSLAPLFFLRIIDYNENEPNRLFIFVFCFCLYHIASNLKLKRPQDIFYLIMRHLFVMSILVLYHFDPTPEASQAISIGLLIYLSRALLHVETVFKISIQTHNFILCELWSVVVYLSLIAFRLFPLHFITSYAYSPSGPLSLVTVGLAWIVVIYNILLTYNYWILHGVPGKALFSRKKHQEPENPEAKEMMVGQLENVV
ncbi:hypothetical protein L596_029668 [Steinernema carpocapsae]|uniref:TLC domain-containing protein n=1 Tax=Steinernema carpocapsae TaxID=34508 RepID=A0A4U5LVC8_STECR|nr:hypothetical protein L596_029668 [Steinernema carpocapsae]